MVRGLGRGFLVVSLAWGCAVAGCGATQGSSGDGGASGSSSGEAGSTSSSGSGSGSGSSGSGSSSGSSSGVGSSSGSGSGSGSGSSSGSSSGVVLDAGHDAPHDAGHGDGGACVNLTVNDIAGSCLVGVNGATPAAFPGKQVFCVPSGTTTLTAAPTDPNNNELGNAPWHGTSGDTGNGDPGTVGGGVDTATVLAIAPKCVWVCCQAIGVPASCPAPSSIQCP